MTISRQISSYYTACRNSVRYDGLPVFLWRIGVKVLSPVALIQHQILFEIDLEQPIEQRRPRVDCRIEAASESDMEAIANSRYKPLPPVDEDQLSDYDEYERVLYERQCATFREVFKKTALQALRAGEMCFVARVGDEIAHS